MGYNVPEGQSARDFIKMKKAKEKLPSASDITKADDIELIELSRESSKISVDLIMDIKDTQTQTDDSLPMRELLGLDTELRSIRGSLKVEVAKKVQLEEHIKKEQRKLERIQEYPGEYDDGIREDITKRIDDLNDELKVRQESINLLKGRLKSQITSFKETIATKVLDKDT